jgi:hypothetical protein
LCLAVGEGILDLLSVTGEATAYTLHDIKR